MKAEMLREEDKPYVSFVVGYLRNRGLDVEFAGSVLKGDKQYRDIDLIVWGDLEAVTGAASALMGFSARTKPFPQRTEDGLEFKVQHIGGPTTYVNNLVDERFKIYGREKTEIDVSLKVI